MKFAETRIKGAFVITLEGYHDERGYFTRTWCREEFRSHGILSLPVQANIAGSTRKGTIRGMHYQEAPDEEAKLIRCARGAVFDVLIDLRPASSTFKEWLAVELQGDADSMFYIPEGCAHGYQTLENDTEITYLTTAFYSPASERGIRWNDPSFGIAWPLKNNIVISEKDQNWPDFS
jgi:dTDP-4-dehydrorhamnose 3,5-epimerase